MELNEQCLDSQTTVPEGLLVNFVYTALQAKSVSVAGTFNDWSEDAFILTKDSIGDFVFYILVFLSVYVQIFFLITFFENRKKIVIRTEEIKLKHYPKVTIVVPCWNEETTIYKTVRSLLNLNYPQEQEMH